MKFPFAYKCQDCGRWLKCRRSCPSLLWRKPNRKQNRKEGFRNVREFDPFSLDEDPFAFTQEQLDLLTEGKCPFCLTADSYVPGPEGGLSINLYCNVCHGGINILRGMNMVEKIRDPHPKG